MRIGRCAAAEQYQWLSLVSPQFVGRAWRYHHAVARPHCPLLITEAHSPAPRGEEIYLLGAAMKVGDGGGSGRYDRLSEALVRRVAGRGSGKLADRRAICGDESLTLLSTDDLHRAKAISPVG